MLKLDSTLGSYARRTSLGDREFNLGFATVKKGTGYTMAALVYPVDTIKHNAMALMRKTSCPGWTVIYPMSAATLEGKTLSLEEVELFRKAMERGVVMR